MPDSLMFDIKDTKETMNESADLEVLQKISAGDFVASDFLFHQSLRSQKERHQLGQTSLKFPVDVCKTQKNCHLELWSCILVDRQHQMPL